MKIIAKKFQTVIVMGIFLMLMVGNTSNDSNSKNQVISPKSAAEQSMIYISGNEELDSFCSGNGTTGLSWADAHVIGNFSMDLYIEQQTCVSFLDIDRYVIIRNVSLRTYRYSLHSALYLSNVTNIRIENITVLNAFYGIRMSSTTNCSVTDSIINAYAYSIYSNDGINIEISNTLSDNFVDQRGFQFSNGRNITVDRCNLNSEREGLIFIDCQTTNILNNTFQQNGGTMIEISGGNDSILTNNSLLTSITSYSETVDISNHIDFSMSLNDFSLSNMGPVRFSNCEYGNLMDNNFSNKGVYFETISSNFLIPESNRVNGKAIKYYEGGQYLDIEGGSYGQVIVNNVNHSHFSNFIVNGSGYGGFQMINTENSTIDLCQVDNTLRYGIAISYSHNFTVQNSSLYNNNIGISMKNASFGALINNSVSSVGEDHGIYAKFLSNVTLLQNTISGYSTGMYLRITENVTGYYNTFIGCTFDFGSGTTNVIFDDTNTKDGKPMYYYYGVLNRIVDLGAIGELYIDHCQHLLIINAVFEGTNDGIMVYDSYDIGFFNITVSNSTDYLLQAEDVMNLTIMNSSFLYSDDYGFYFYNVTNLVITNCLFGNISGYPASFEDVTNVIFSQNWVVNCSEPIYFDEFDNVIITDNCYVNNETDWLEIYYDTGNETIVVDNNLNQSAYDPNYFPGVTVEDIMGRMNITVEDTGTDTGTTLIPTTLPSDSPFNWGDFILFVGILIGVAAAGVLIYIYLRSKKTQS